MNATHIPELNARSNSWVVTRAATNEVIGEFYNRKIVDRFNPEVCRIETAEQYLGRINTAIMAGEDGPWFTFHPIHHPKGSKR